MAASALRRADDDPAARSVAHRTLSIAARERHDLVAARDAARVAAEIASDAGLDVLEGLARLTLASVLVASGAGIDALLELDRAEMLVDAHGMALLHMQRGTVLQRLDQLDEAVASFERAVVAARVVDDRLTEALTRVNRGVLHAYADRLPAAAEDLARAERLFAELDLELAGADACHNRGFVAAAMGDTAAALHLFQRARATYDRLGTSRPNALVDEAEALFDARLLEPAAAAAASAVGQLRGDGEAAHLAEALLLLAEVLEALRRNAESAAAASEAATLFEIQRRPRWSVLASAVALRLSGDATSAAVRAMAQRLSDAGWLDQAAAMHLFAAELAVAEGDRSAGLIDLDSLARARHRGPVRRRVHGWHALALARHLRGDEAGARRAATSGIRLVAESAAALAATDLRARAGDVALPLVDIGLASALGGREPRRVLLWAERWRAAGIAGGHTRLPDVPALADLRAVMRSLRVESLATYERAELDRRRRDLEHEIDRVTRSAPTSTAPASEDLDLRSLVADVGGRALVEFVAHRGALHRIVVGRGRVRLLEPASLAEIDREVRALRLAASRLALGTTHPGSELHASMAADRLDAILFSGVRLADDAVIVPTGVLHAVPWSLLPSLRGIAYSVAPSAALWTAAADVARLGWAHALVVNVGVGGGRDEANAVAAAYDDVRVLDDTSATTSAVLDALEWADVAHLAVHGSFRADNPLYSSLQLADGPLFVHDLDRLRHTPRVVVLSSCGTAQSDVAGGDELLGIAASFLRTKTSALISSTLAVADDAAPPFMTALHQALRRDSPAFALRSARLRVPGAAGIAFSCLGRG